MDSVFRRTIYRSNLAAVNGTLRAKNVGVCHPVVLCPVRNGLRDIRTPRSLIGRFLRSLIGRLFPFLKQLPPAVLLELGRYHSRPLGNGEGQFGTRAIERLEFERRKVRQHDVYGAVYVHRVPLEFTEVLAETGRKVVIRKFGNDVVLNRVADVLRTVQADGHLFLLRLRVLFPPPDPFLEV